MSNNDHSQFRAKLLQLSKIVEEALIGYVDEWQIEGETVREAMKYSIKAGGKRIRPVLMLAVAKMCDKPYSLVLPYACALELIHTFSLIHDDLPCMDDDDLRRGMPTSHKVYGEGIAVLTGDAMLNMAFEIILQEAEKNIGSLKHIKASRIIAKSAGISGMISGQVLDVEAEGREISFQELKKIHSLKTGALLSAPIMAAAELCEINDQEKKALSIFSTNLGLTFQIVDDLLDVIGDQSKLGKTVGSDNAKSKSTFVKIVGIDESREIVNSLTQESLEQLKTIKGNIWFLEELSEFLAKREQ